MNDWNLATELSLKTNNDRNALIEKLPYVFDSSKSTLMADVLLAGEKVGRNNNL